MRPLRVLSPAAEIVGGDEVGEMATELVVALVVEALDRRILDGSVHPLDLAIGPWMFGLGRAVLDVVRGAGVFEGMCPEEFAVCDASLISGTAEPLAPGVVNWMPLSVSTVWIL